MWVKECAGRAKFRGGRVEVGGPWTRNRWGRVGAGGRSPLHHPPGQALTGPVVRGDVPVLSRHARALAGRDDDLPRTYRALAERALDLARRHRDLSPEDAAALAAVLETLPR